jgi:VIT1/CCC1 family predicted Fe2+/Mn2+ transporter
MKISIRKGFSFGLTSGIITTLGLIVGLHSSTHSTPVVIGGILVIAIADALSDALGMHVSEESENRHTTREVWESTAVTLLSKFVFSLSFAVPVLLFPLKAAILASIAWGLFLIVLLSLHVARVAGIRPYKPAAEHMTIAVFVIIITHYLGDWVSTLA